MPIWIDYREKLLLNLAKAGSFDKPVVEFAPPVGDIWIGDVSGIEMQPGGVILERKTAADLEASIMDGRYAEQRARLLAYATEHKVAIGYVIEGILDRLDARLSESALLKHITRLQFHHRIPAVQTDSAKDTLRLAGLIDEQWLKEKGQFSWNCTDISSNASSASYIKSECRDRPETFLLGTLTQCRGISEALARLIMTKFTTLKDLMAATADELAVITDPANPKRKVGKAVAGRLYGLLHVEINSKEIV